MAIVGRLERMLPALDKTVKDMLVVKQLRWDIARLEGTVGLNSTNLSKLNEHYRKTFVSFKQQLSSLTQDMNNNINAGSGQNNILLLQNEVAALQGNFQTLQESFRSSNSANDIDDVNARIKDIESRVSGDSCSVGDGDYVFTSETEVGKWILDEKVSSFGIFWDIFSVLVVMVSKKLSGKERADTQYSSERVNTTTSENNISASMSFLRPPALYADKGGDICPLENGFAACKTHSEWIKGVESFKNRHTSLLKNQLKGLKGNISQNMGGSALAKLLFTDIAAQWNKIIGFIDSFFQELTETSKFPKYKAWCLVGQCCGSIFDAMLPYRAVVAQIEDLDNHESRIKFLWCTLQCHRVMNDFIAKQFRGHPQMVKQISLFMIHERVDPVLFSTMEDTVKKQSQTIDKLEKELTQAKRTLGLFDGLRKEINDLQKSDKDLARAKKDK